MLSGDSVTIGNITLLQSQVVLIVVALIAVCMILSFVKRLGKFIIVLLICLSTFGYLKTAIPNNWKHLSVRVEDMNFSKLDSLANTSSLLQIKGEHLYYNDNGSWTLISDLSDLPDSLKDCLAYKNCLPR